MLLLSRQVLSLRIVKNLKNNHMKKSSVERVMKGIRIKKVNAKKLDILAEHQSRKINATLDLIIEYYFDNNPTDQKI